MNMKSGVIILDKEEGISSQGAVNRIKRLFGAEKAGHTGTLDPIATGVLPVLIGRAVKASEFLLTGDKHYSAGLILGINTDTEDITGRVTERFDFIPDKAEVLSAIRSMKGVSEQVPPMFSALKVGGKKLYELAREGKSIERAARKICVYEIDGERLSDNEYEIDVKCSKGTYIRTLCSDIGKRLGCGGAMKSLRRLSASGFSINEAHTLSEIEAMSDKEREALIIPTERIFEGLRRVKLSPFFSRLARCGVEIYLKKIGESIPIGERVTLYDSDCFFALGEVQSFEGGEAIKPIRQFDI